MKDSFRHTPFRREQPPNAQRGSMELWLSYIEKSPRNQTPFMFYVVDADTGYGVKGAEFDTVIAFGLLEDYVPHFSDPNKVENAKRILYVIASRARKNLYLISEQDRGKIPTIILNNYKYKY